MNVNLCNLSVVPIRSVMISDLINDTHPSVFDEAKIEHMFRGVLEKSSTPTDV